MKIFILEADTNLVPERAIETGRIVTLFLREGKEKRNFRCLNCGKLIFKYTGELDQVFDGAIKNTEEPTIDTICSRCKIIYRVFMVK
ncbi:hypothetical protein LCGC14_3156540 [marine sediment metagenome]|uniref:Uncharacterized protein n=1 Tax=marine sediment metagenome TaxID=412755 RepID=A0A0F8YGZ3_9ZZZZ